MRTYKEVDEGFAYMEAVFMPIDRDKPNLPFREYITEHGQHPIIRRNAKSDHHYFAKYSIPRKDGMMEVSVISGSMFYCTPNAPYEVAVNGDEPLDRLTDEDLIILLAKIIAGGDHGIQE